MNILPIEKQISAIASLSEGNSIRATERLIGVHRDTIMRLGVRVGRGCKRLHDALFVNLHSSVIQVDELWAYIGKKQARVRAAHDSAEMGDQYTYLAMDDLNKAILSYYTGKRSAPSTRAFIADLRQRVVNQPQINSDGFAPYRDAILGTFGPTVDYAMIVKNYAVAQGNQAQVRYSPGAVVAVSKQVVAGNPNPRRTSTSHIERVNLSVRMSQRRFTRLTNGFSKKLENHEAAVALFVAHYNLCRVHETIRMTPAMAMGVTDHIWSIGELVSQALTQPEPEPTPWRKGGPFRVIVGGGRG